MSPQRIAEVYAVARKWDLVVVEDDAYYWLQFPHGPQQVPGLNLRRKCGSQYSAPLLLRSLQPLRQQLGLTDTRLACLLACAAHTSYSACF